MLLIDPYCSPWKRRAWYIFKARHSSSGSVQTIARNVNLVKIDDMLDVVYFKVFCGHVRWNHHRQLVVSKRLQNKFAIWLLQVPKDTADFEFAFSRGPVYFVNSCSKASMSLVFFNQVIQKIQNHSRFFLPRIIREFKFFDHSHLKILNQNWLFCRFSLIWPTELEQVSQARLSLFEVQCCPQLSWSWARNPFPKLGQSHPTPDSTLSLRPPFWIHVQFTWTELVLVSICQKCWKLFLLDSHYLMECVRQICHRRSSKSELRYLGTLTWWSSKQLSFQS